MYSLLWSSEEGETLVGTYDSWAAALTVVPVLLPTEVRSISIVRSNSKALCDRKETVVLYTVLDQRKQLCIRCTGQPLG